MKVPFNDLYRIHKPLIRDFRNSLNRIVRNSEFVLGDEVDQFEIELGKVEGSKFAIGINNGTNSLELILRSLGIGEGDEVITTAFTFIATVHAIERTGAMVKLVDIKENIPIMDINKLEASITKNTKAIVFVSLHGIVDCIYELRQLSEKHGILLILDGAQSHVATFAGKPLVENFQAISLSFYPGKNLGALGEGGAVLTNNSEIARKIKLFRNWGSKVRYEHDNWGGNFRIESLQASFLTAKLKHIKRWTAMRKEAAKIYSENLDKKIQIGSISNVGDHVYHVFSIQVENREKLISFLNLNQIGWGIHYPRAIHQNYQYKHLNRATLELANSESFAARTLSLPIFPGITENELHYVIDAINNFQGNL